MTTWGDREIAFCERVKADCTLIFGLEVQFDRLADLDFANCDMFAADRFMKAGDKGRAVKGLRLLLRTAGHGC